MRVIINLTGLLLIFLNIGCDNMNSMKVAENEEVISSNRNTSSQLRIMGHWYGEGKKESIVRESVREFSLLNQNYSIDLQFPHHIFIGVEESQLYFAEYDSIAKMVNTNYWPFDVLFCDQERYKKVGEMVGDPNWGEKYLVDFSDKPWFKAAHKHGLFQTVDFTKKYGGIVPGPIFEGITNILFVSSEIEQKIGIKVKDLDMTSSDLMDYAKAVYEYNNSHSDKITFFSTQLGGSPDMLFSQLVLSLYGKNAPGIREEGLQALEEAYNYFEQLAQYKPLEQYIDNSGMLYDKAQRILYHNKCLFTMQPSWMYLLWEKSNPEGTRVMRPCEIPSMNGYTSSSYVGFYQVIFVVPRNSKNPKGAEEFIKFISTADVADKWIKYSKCPTGLQNNISYTDFGQDYFDNFFRHIQKKYGNNQMEINLSSYLLNSEKSISFNTKEVLNGTVTASEAVNRVKNQLR